MAPESSLFFSHMHNPVQRKIRLGFFIAFSVIIAASFFSYLVTKNLLDNATRLNHTIEVSKRLETIIKQLKDAEAAIRGFNLTKDSAFLHPDMAERSNRIANEYAALRHITTDSQRQQRHLDTLKILLDIKYQQLKVGARSDTPSREKQSVTEGEKVMDRIEQQVDDMMHIEDAQLHEKAELFRFFFCTMGAGDLHLLTGGHPDWYLFLHYPYQRV